MGIDLLEAEKFAPLRGKHVGLITNHTGVDLQGKPTIDVLAHAPGLADAVIAGALSLDEAYVRAREIKAAAESDEARLAQLRSEFPDLADKVTEEALTLTAALVEARERNAARRRDAEQAADAAQTIVARTQSAVVAILLGREQGVENLITKDTIEALRAAIDQLEEAL